ncbi:MAG: type II toxin-antitoxin system death-on-curing family toxin [Planctomycetota bacterium]
MSDQAINFLSVETILKLHAIAIEDQRGDPSLRDRGLLESAVGMPMQQFAGEFLHPDIPAMAAAYAFHICGNHPFVDGNKRAGLAAMLAFLVDNGWTFGADEVETETMIVRLASGLVPKDELTAWVRLRARLGPGST